MEVGFIVLEKFNLPKFRVTVSFMHGDADAYSNTVENFETVGEVREFVKFVKAIQEFSETHECEDDIDFSDLAVALDCSVDDARYSFYDTVPADCTFDENRAKLQGWDIVMFAENVEHRIALVE